MMRRILCLLAITFCLFAAEETRRPATVSTTDRLDFAPGGVIRVNGSYGYLTIEGWDEPSVQITVTKCTDRLYEAGQTDTAERRLGLVRVMTERRSSTELAINTARRRKAHVTLDYRILAPRDSQLIIHHGSGFVWVAGMTGDIEAHSHSGDMILIQSATERYSIDARTRFGDVSSDFEGVDKSQFLVGDRFTHLVEEPLRRLFLRMGRGKITIRRDGPLPSARTN